jgi:hypothetical protein
MNVANYQPLEEFTDLKMVLTAIYFLNPFEAKSGFMGQ